MSLSTQRRSGQDGVNVLSRRGGEAVDDPVGALVDHVDGVALAVRHVDASRVVTHGWAEKAGGPRIGRRGRLRRTLPRSCRAASRVPSIARAASRSPARASGSTQRGEDRRPAHGRGPAQGVRDVLVADAPASQPSLR